MVGLDYRNAIENNWFYWFVFVPFGSDKGVKRMIDTSTAIILIGSVLVIAISWSTPTNRDYHTDLKNIAYQLSRIADALNRSKDNE